MKRGVTHSFIDNNDDYGMLCGNITCLQSTSHDKEYSRAHAFYR